MTPSGAQPLELHGGERRRLNRLIALGVVHEAGTQRFYLDAPALADLMESRRQNAALAVIVIVLLFVALFLWAPLRSR